jgi:hypothetical protein
LPHNCRSLVHSVIASAALWTFPTSNQYSHFQPDTTFL